MEMLRHHRADLILANSRANNCGGWGIADQIRRFDTQVPIILLGNASEETPDSRTMRDIQAYLLTELAEGELMAAITRWVPRARSTTPINYPGTILVVDDEPELVRNLVEFLEPRGCDVVTAISGEEALEQAARCKPTLAILDVKMAGMDGLVTLKKLRVLFPGLLTIMATAVQDDVVMAEAFGLGACEYIMKPYNLRELEETLRRLKRLSRA